jgi:outer membrane lipoprotein SlyB
MKAVFSTMVVAALVATLTGCAGGSMGMGGGEQSPTEIRQGRIEQITATQVKHPHELGVGAILGGAGGAAIGSLIGAGTGRDVAIAMGAIAGAVGGQYAQNHYDKPKPAQQIVVRLNSGVLVVVTQAPNPSLFVGERVYVEGSGPSAQVVAQH